ncbi:G2/M phase-specific E3 ubiquitin-protein ligase-like isoform X1 [Chanodichthys erythropterus]|uniref:G2/M phase-specific E3 ubiquitin-protein ligase-like isoform X1 n=1 Tax=Chanodichthys erythropterus TaxID=933992 RepID=UPI00351EB1E0
MIQMKQAHQRQEAHQTDLLISLCLFLDKISSAASLNELHMLIDKYASLLQTAGCFDYPRSVEGKDNIVKDFIQYILYRNQYSIQRFRNGLSTLDVIHALEQLRLEC